MALTPKQAKVKEMLDDNKTIPQIAKALGITNQGVYGHIRRMRASRLASSPQSRAKSTPAADRHAASRRRRIKTSGPPAGGTVIAGASVNRVDEVVAGAISVDHGDEVDVTGMIEAGIVKIKDRIRIVDDLDAGHQSAMEKLAAERVSLENQFKRFVKARESFNT